MVAVSVGLGRREQRLFHVVVGGVGEDSVLHVATQEALLREGGRILHRVVSPAVHSAEEQGAVGLLSHVLV